MPSVGGRVPDFETATQVRLVPPADLVCALARCGRPQLRGAKGALGPLLLASEAVFFLVLGGSLF